MSHVVVDLRTVDPDDPGAAGEYALRLTKGLLATGGHDYTVLGRGSPDALPAADVLLLPAGGAPRPGFRNVSCIPDLTHLLARRRMTVAAAIRRGLAVAFSAHRSDRVFAPSRFVAEGVVRYLRVDARRVAVVHPGVEVDFARTSLAAADAVRDELDLGDRYCLAVGDRRVAEAAFAGAVKPKEARLVHLADLRIARDRLAALFSGAVGVLLTDPACGCPAYAVMAMACGSPPIAGTDGAYPEVVRDGGLLADPAHVSEWSECVAALYRSRALRARLSQQAMKLAADLTAENAARALLPLLG